MKKNNKSVFCSNPCEKHDECELLKIGTAAMNSRILRQHLTDTGNPEIHQIIPKIIELVFSEYEIEDVKGTQEDLLKIVSESNDEEEVFRVVRHLLKPFVVDVSRSTMAFVVIGTRFRSDMMT